MRRILAIVSAVAISITGLVAVPAQASLPANGSYNCTTNGLNTGTFAITNGVVLSGGPNNGGGNCTGHADIPNGVTAIGPGAFAQGSLSTISLPNSVTLIDQTAFYQSSLSTVVIPNSVLTIGDSAFRHMPNLTTITIPSSVQSIGYLAFGTTPLTSITFTAPSSLTTIGPYAFQSTRFTSINIPGSVTSIGDGAFQQNTDLTSITIPSGITAISPYTFDGATGLTQISIPIGVTEIGREAFKGATSLTSITLPNSVTDIGIQAFFDTRLTSLTIPSGVTTIRDDTFGRIGTLTSITFPNTLTSIEPGSFFDANALTTVTIPSSVTTIGQYAFGGLYNSLAEINFLGNAPSVHEESFYLAGIGTKANITESATGYGQDGSTWKGLTITRATAPPPPPPPPSSSSLEIAPRIEPLTRVSSVQIQAGKNAKSSKVMFQLSGVKQGLSNENIKIKIFDTKGKLFKTLTIPINETAGSMELTLPLALGDFTVEANTVSAAGGVTETMSASSPIVQRSFFSKSSTNRAPILFGETFAKPISFGASSSTLTPKERRALVRISATLKKTRSSVAITGFVAQSGASKGFDQNLAKSRAISVARFLQSQGISNILYVSGFGAINNSRNLDDLRKVELRLIK